MIHATTTCPFSSPPSDSPPTEAPEVASDAVPAPGQLFVAHSPLAQRLASTGPHQDPIAAARRLLSQLREEEQLAALDAHPRIGARPQRLSALAPAAPA